MVIEIRNVYRPVVTDRQAGDRGEPAVERAEDVDRQGTAPLARESAVGGEFLHSVVVAVGDQENAAGAEGHVRGVIELTGPDAGLARGSPLADEGSVGLELLNSLIVEIGHVEIAVGGDGDAARGIELAGAAAGASDAAARRSIEAEHLDAVVPVIGDVEFSARDPQIHRPAEFAGSLTGRAELALEAALEIEHLDAAVPGVGDEQLIAGNRDAGGVVELPRTTALPAPGHDEFESGLPGPRHEGQPAGDQSNRNEKHQAAENFEKSASHGYPITA